MNQYQQLQQFIKGLKLPHRGQCPVCSGINSFSATISCGVVLYHCYRASCGLKGKTNYEISIDNLRDSSLQLATLNSNTMGVRQDTAYIVPDFFVSPLSNTRCYSFLSSFSLLDLYTKFTDRIRYDPRLNRLVFILKDKDNVCRGAVGRLLVYSNIYPRWLVYERLQGCHFYLGATKSKVSALLVEDCVSACVATSYSNSSYDCCALLGTSISDEMIKYLLDYKKIFIALDDDATKKSIELQKKLSPYVETHIIPIRKDIKYFDRNEFKELEKDFLSD